ncbi:MAG TPA: zinc-dependent metalloprotease [Flavitalea sp.]|nr:zinc-dependent metalloprotease [Flavitalea sp.]
MRFKIAFLVSLVLVVSAQSGFAQDTTATKKTEPPKIRPFSDVITAKAITSNGLFATHKVDEKYYFEIPDSLLGREFLFTTRLSKVPTNSPLYAGELVNGIIVSFEKAGNDKLYLRASTKVAVADSNQVIARAVRNATIDPIIMVMDIKSHGKGNKSSLIEVTDFILKDNNITGFNAEAKKNMLLTSVTADRSFILSVNAFKGNIEIKTVKTFGIGGVSKPQGAEGGGADAAAGPGAGASSVNVTMELSNSVMLLPEQQMTARHSDPRVGYYTENYKVFADDQQEVEQKDFIVRQRLEPKPEDMERYKRGELVEPKEPIVYYVDPATPKQWRPYIIAGINDWNEAFKAAGFKNAIIGKEWPETDSTMSLEDARCKVIRYFPAGLSFSYATRVYDPRSGEILQTYIGWSHSKLKSLHEWYFVQAAAVDARARTMKFSDELMGALVRADISRQIGGSLGLRMNLAASSAIPVEKLRDQNYLEANSFSGSIMDAIHYNYVAQPGDHISPKGLIPQIGEYDKWAIKYGYTYTGINDFEKEKKEVLGWINKSQIANPGLRFGEANSVSPNDPIMPDAQTEDLGNNAIKASEYGISNMKIVMANILDWTREDMDMYDNAFRMYGNLVDWWGMLARHVYSQVGGIQENLKTVEQYGDVYTPVSKELQKQAVAFLNKEVFQMPTWLVDPHVLNKFNKPAKREMVQRLQENAMYYIMNSGRLYRMSAEAMRFPKEKLYTIDELFTDLEKGLWSELKSPQPVINANRRVIQKSWVENIKLVMRDATNAPSPGSASPDLTSTDIPAVVRAHMNKVMQLCKTAEVGCKDPMTLAHLRYVQGRLQKILDNKD